MGQVNGKILLLGSTGMAGHVVLKYLRASGLQVDDIARNDHHFKPTFKLDIRDTKALGTIIQEGSYSIVINCIGVLNNAVSENPEDAILLNSYLPHYLARLLRERSGRLITLSTDCVFSGTKGGYVEQDDKDGSSMYAQSKSLGEVVYDSHLTIRTSIIGPELNEKGIGLLKWYLNQQGIIKGYKNAIWSGVTTPELAKFIYWLLERPEIKGIVHLTNNKRISKHALLCLMHEIIGNKNIVDIEPFEDFFTDKSFLNTRDDICYDVPDYKSMMMDLKNWMLSHQCYY